MSAPPRFDLTSYFPSFEAPERAAFEASLGRDLALLLEATSTLPAVGHDHDADWVDAVLRYEDLIGRLGHVRSYVVCLASSDAGDTRYQQAEARLDLLSATLDKVAVELKRAFGGASEEAFARFVSADALTGAEHALERLRVEASMSMDPKLESLTADLAPHGILAWGRLYDVLSSKLRFTMQTPDGQTKRVPMAQRRSLLGDADREVRRAAFEGGNQAWAEVADVTAMALNQIAGTRQVLGARRGVAEVIDTALFQANTSRRTLDAMMEAVDAARPLARRALSLKARAMGLSALTYYDFEAPLPLGEAARVDWARATTQLRQAFGASYPKLGAFFDRAIEARWVEAEPRDGKRPGAYCTGSEVTGEPRVFMTYSGAPRDVATLAHEIGHAFHHVVMNEQRVLARIVPMTLAETASTFAEALLERGALADPGLSKRQRASVIGSVLSDASAFLLDIPTRYRFERAFYEERKSGELSPAQLCELMTATQREVIGDALAEGGEDPYFWSSKLHFFIPDLCFYNFPYTFGFLLARGLVNAFDEEGPAFLPRYESFLAATGSAPAHEVAKRCLGRDLEAPEFWAGAIESLSPYVDELASLLDAIEREGSGR